MKRSLLIFIFSLFICFSCLVFTSDGQVVIFSEDFSGFITGTHTTPSTSDASGSLDTKTLIPGWFGYKIYSAGGEIKIGTASVTGWIETPPIDLSGHDEELILEFDICRWPGDATMVKILLNDVQLGELIEPKDEYEKIIVPVTSGTVSAKIKFEAESKRFFLDNIIIRTDEPTSVKPDKEETSRVLIYPNPAEDIITATNIEGCIHIEICDLYGNIVRQVNTSGKGHMKLSLAELSSSVYYIRFYYPAGYISRKLIKSR